MKHAKMILVTVIIMAFGFGFVSIEKGFQKKPWDVPAANKNTKNPQKSDANSQNLGKAEWNKTCKACHGMKGLGDGPKAKTLKTPAGDFSTELKGQTDGELFYKTKMGRGDMPKYDKKIPDADIWNLINYMRTFQK
jgi:mono/diheme cytochrome c family protein